MVEKFIEPYVFWILVRYIYIISRKKQYSVTLE